MADVWTTPESIETLPTNLIEINNTYDLNEFLEENDWPINSLGPKRDSLYVVIPITIIYAIIFFTGVIGNVSTCIVISRNKSMHTATNYYLFSLAVSDLLLLVSGLPQEMYSIWSRYPYVFGEIFCVLRGLAAETSANATVLTITAFTVERYVAICHPFLSHTMSKLSRAIKLILSIWVVALCFAIPQALQFGVINKPEVLCVVKRTLIDHSFELSTFLFFIAPMTLITVLYALIGLRLRSSNIMKRDRHNTVSCREQARCQDANGGNDEYRRSCRHQHGQSSKRVLKMLVAVVVAFFICWAPFHAQRLVAIYVDDTHTNHTNMKVYEIVTYISGILYYVSTTVNPVLYHIMSNKFREAFKETFARCCGRRRTKRRSYSILSRSQALQSQQKYAGTGSEHRSGRCQTHESTTDSGTSITNRHSEDSTCFHPAGERSTLSQQCRRENPDQSLADKSIHHNQMESNCVMARSNLNTSNLSVSKRKLNTRTARFLRAFHCLAKRTLDDKFQSSGYPSPVIEDHITKDNINNKIDESYCMVSCNVSNSSLKDIENGALEDELTTYMREIHNRELTNS